MKVFFCLTIFLTLSISLFGQNTEIIIKSQVLDSLTKNGIENVLIYSENEKYFTTSDIDGAFELNVDKDYEGKFFLKHPAYQQNKLENLDELKNKVFMNIDFITLGTAEIKVNKPDTMFSSKVFNIYDFEFIGDNHYLFLTYPKRSGKNLSLVYADKEQNIIDRFELPYKVDELEKDFLGFINAIGEEKIYRVEIKNEEIKVAELPRSDYLSKIQPVKDSLYEDLYFSDYRWNIPDFQYQFYTQSDSTVHKLPKVSNPKTAAIYYYEYYYLSGKERVLAMKMEAATGISRHHYANQMTKYPNSLNYKPTFAPIIRNKDTMMVFDHYKNYIFKYGKKDTMAFDSIPITYHLKDNWKAWKRKLYPDIDNPRYVYALYFYKTKYYLKKVDTYTGKVKYVKELYHKYVSNIQIKGGYVYYTYKPFESIQKKFLYREGI